jgi:Domain of unknown function (DUF4956)
MNKSIVRMVVVFVAVLLGSALLAYILLDRTQGPAINRADNHAAASSQPGSNPTQTPAATQTQNNNRSILSEIFGIHASEATPTDSEPREVVALRVLIRFLIAALLAALLAFRWRRGLSLTRRNPYVAQTQILLAVVAAAMMMIVGDSAARAFGIFAAASLVRFRTNIRDPKETTVLLICLGVGLACGVGRLDMALILTAFVLLALWILEYFEAAQIFRSMDLRIETRNVDQTHQVLKRLFERHGCTFELRQLERGATEGSTGTIVYELSLGTEATTDELSAEIMADDPENIAGLEWEQKKSSTYIYN